MNDASTRRRRRAAGFTLVELSVVILIIGLMTSFLLVASWQGLQRGNESATEALITKLEVAMDDRVQALTTQRPQANNAHRFLAVTLTGDPDSPFVESEPRARLIAKIDYLRAELPDVFFVQDDPLYPLNFAGLPYHPIGSPSNPVPSPFSAYFRYTLPLGNGVIPRDRVITTSKGNFVLPVAGGNVTNPAGTGIFGASYQAIAAITKQLGYPPRGYNGTDDNENGLIDERVADEFGLSQPAFNALNVQINLKLGNHRHITARSEMLYAILVEGAGPLGSVFSPDDFTDREVRDTDGDGLMEFVDAWGNPLQFYRWPLYYVTERGTDESFQKGSATYSGVVEPRQQNPLDPNQLLVAPAWWVDMPTMASSGDVPDHSGQMSDQANLFQQHFFSLVDPYADIYGRNDPPGPLWDRTNFYKRRAYFYKFLIASAGPDEQYGIGSYGLTYSTAGQEESPPFMIPSNGRDAFAARMILIENQASRSDPFARVDPSNNNEGQAGSITIDQAGRRPGRMALYQLPSPQVVPQANDFTALILDQWGLDDITNQNINSSTGGL